jgi:hypothetical protein
MRKAQTAVTLASDATKLELLTVLERPRFDRYVESGIRRAVVAEYIRNCEPVSIPFPIRVCRDPGDDMFLEVAVYGRADFIVTGDEDELSLNPFRSVAILTPDAFLGLDTEGP